MNLHKYKEIFYEKGAHHFSCFTVPTCINPGLVLYFALPTWGVQYSFYTMGEKINDNKVSVRIYNYISQNMSSKLEILKQTHRKSEFNYEINEKKEFAQFCLFSGVFVRCIENMSIDHSLLWTYLLTKGLWNICVINTFQDISTFLQKEKKCSFNPLEIGKTQLCC